MTELQKEFEKTGYASWVNSDLYPDGKAYTNEYVMWLENKVSQQAKEQWNAAIDAAAESAEAFIGVKDEPIVSKGSILKLKKP